mmetsp:Transcript_10372/g.30821  ORF Transcript_10372/g.30821 Transcript_10372/m.30821 type:complete len:651 (+) Transcript_10372:119-2071(+)
MENGNAMRHDVSMHSANGNGAVHEDHAKAKAAWSVMRRQTSKVSSGSAEAHAQPKGVFVGLDREKMKQAVRERLTRPVYNVKDKYHTTGIWQAIARHPTFENTTLGVIGFNALWIWIDTDYNKSAMLLMAKPHFQIMEHLFAVYFCFEWFTRFMAFAKKRDGFRDGWFCFDSALVFMMFAETWVMTLVIASSGGGGGGAMGNTAILRLFRLLRLTRMLRMLRSMPELLILIKGMMAAMRSVMFVMALLVMLMYVFAIAFTQLCEGSDVGEQYFSTIPHSMYTLTMAGTFLDNITDVVDNIRNEIPVVAALFILFVLLAALTLMNMLIGVLCEVVQGVANVEREEMSVSFANTRMKEIISQLDEDGSGAISKEEFQEILNNGEAVRALADVGVDPIGLVDFADSIFESESTGEGVELSFPEFMDIVLQFRGSNGATVKDMVDMRKFMVKTIRQELRRFHVDGGHGNESRAGSHRLPPKIMSSPTIIGDRQTSKPSTRPLKPDQEKLKSHLIRLEASLTAGLSEARRLGESLGGPNAPQPPGTNVPGQVDSESTIDAKEVETTWAKLEEFVTCSIPELQAIQDHLGHPPPVAATGLSSCVASLLDFIIKGGFADFKSVQPFAVRNKVEATETFLQARIKELQTARGQIHILS